MNSINFLPGNCDFKIEGGDDATFTLTFPYNTTGGTHIMMIATSANGVAILTLTNGSGLVVTNGSTTTVAVTIPRDFTAEQSKKDGAKAVTLFYIYKLTLSGLKKSKMSGQITLQPSIVEAS